MLTNFHGDEAKKKFFFWKKKFKMADSKKAHFAKSPILKIFSRKFLRFVLRLVGLNDAKGNVYGREAVRQKLKNSHFDFFSEVTSYKIHILGLHVYLGSSLVKVQIRIHW